MEIAVLSDIHSNYVALDACMEYIKKRNIKQLIFLGDYLADMAKPQKTMERIYRIKEEYNCIFIRGNKEDYWKEHREGKSPYWKIGSTGTLLYTYERLTKKDVAFFDAMPPVLKLELEGLPAITLCHGSPFKTNENMRPGKDRTFEIMEKVDTGIILCGHTHFQCKIENAGKKVLNCGAVGVPYHSDGKTQFMILHGEENESSSACGGQRGQWIEEFISLDYDRERVIEEMMTSEVHDYSPYWCQITACLLRKGNPSHGEVLIEAMRLCKEETGDAIWYDVPEKYWKMAVEKMCEL